MRQNRAREALEELARQRRQAGELDRIDYHLAGQVPPAVELGRIRRGDDAVVVERRQHQGRPYICIRAAGRSISLRIGELPGVIAALQRGAS